LEQFGDKLLCVRYRYDEIRQVRMKTVEIIVEERPCKPPLRYRDQDIVAVMVPYTMKALRDRLKAAGGRWNPEKQLWFVKYGNIAGTILEKHIQVDERDKPGKPKKHLYVYA